MLELEALKIEALQALVRPGQHCMDDCCLLQGIASRIRALAKPAEPSTASASTATVGKRRECWEIRLKAGRIGYTWFNSESAAGRFTAGTNTTKHRMVELRDGDVVLSAEQAEKVRGAIRRAVLANVGTGLSCDDLHALGIEVES